jgi:hypothetical protein
MMTSIFGDQNYLNQLCYLDDLLAFAPVEKTAPPSVWRLCLADSVVIT